MTPHKHAEIIKAWADGAEIEARTLCTHVRNSNEWFDTTDPVWSNKNLDFRIKPETKPDYITFLTFTENGWSEAPISCYVRNSERALKLIHDGETGKIKSTEIV
jgi:hypothetical protein